MASKVGQRERLQDIDLVPTIDDKYISTQAVRAAAARHDPNRVIWVEIPALGF